MQRYVAATHKLHMHTQMGETPHLPLKWLIYRCALALQSIAFLKRYTGDGAEVKFKSFIRVDYDKQRYVLASHKQEVC